MSFDYLTNLLEFYLSLGPVTCYVIHIIVTLGSGELVLESFFLRSSGLDMVSTELDTAELGIRPVVTQVPRL